MASQALLAWPEGQLHRLLEQAEEGTSTRIRKLLLRDYYLPYLPRLLAGDVDRVRCDFILRDAHQSGVSHGRYDLKWLVSTTTVGKTSNNQLVAGFDKRKAPRVIEQFLIVIIDRFVQRSSGDEVRLTVPSGHVFDSRASVAKSRSKPNMLTFVPALRRVRNCLAPR